MPVPTFSFNSELLRSKLGPEVADEFRNLEQALNTIAQHTNANPLGPVDSPPQISSVIATPKGGGVHQITIQDSNPVARGINYFAEYSQTSDFANFTTVPMGPSRQVDIAPGTGPIFVRAYSSYLTSQPSTPVYHGGDPANQTAVNSTGTTAAVAAGIAGTGSGTEPSNNPKGAAGFGFDPVRGFNSPQIPQP